MKVKELVPWLTRFGMDPEAILVALGDIELPEDEGVSREPIAPGEEDLVTPEEATRMYGLSRATIPRWISEGKLQTTPPRLGIRGRFVRKSDVEKLVKESKPQRERQSRRRKPSVGEFITITEASKKYSVSENTIRNRIRKGELQARGKPLKVVAVDVAELAKTVKRHPWVGDRNRRRARKKPQKTRKRGPTKKQKAERLKKGPLTAEENRTRIRTLRQQEAEEGENAELDRMLREEGYGEETVERGDE